MKKKKLKKAFKRVIKFYGKCMNDLILGISVDEELIEKLEDDSKEVGKAICELRFRVYPRSKDPNRLDSFEVTARGFMSAEELIEHVKEAYEKNATIELISRIKEVPQELVDKIDMMYQTICHNDLKQWYDKKIKDYEKEKFTYRKEQ